MSNSASRIRYPVRRGRAEFYLLLTLLSFAVSVAAIRLFLELTGYPQIGNSELHIAHVLWGGLFLFLASLLPLILANRWTYALGAVLGGVGVGLFIDEVGKFITSSNDYFYPLAAPIVYAIFLLTVLIYLQVRRPPPRNPRAEMYRALDGLMEVLDNDLDPEEHAHLEARLGYIAGQSEQPELSRLADALLEFLRSEELDIAPEVPTIWRRMVSQLQKFEARWLNARRMKFLLIVAFALFWLSALFELIASILIILSPQTLEAIALEIVVVEQQIRGATSFGWFIVRLVLEAEVGALCFLTMLLFILGKNQTAIRLGVLVLLLSLTTVNLLIFYFDQFSTIMLTSVQFGLLLFLLRYRQLYLQGAQVPPEQT